MKVPNVERRIDVFILKQYPRVFITALVDRNKMTAPTNQFMWQIILAFWKPCLKDGNTLMNWSRQKRELDCKTFLFYFQIYNCREDWGLSIWHCSSLYTLPLLLYGSLVLPCYIFVILVRRIVTSIYSQKRTKRFSLSIRRLR